MEVPELPAEEEDFGLASADAYEQPSPSSYDTGRPPRATSSAGSRSATIAPLPSWSAWRRKGSSGPPTMRASARSCAASSRTEFEHHGAARRAPPPQRRGQASLP